jgi:uncharacterized protein (TIGR02246 family)
MTQPPPPAVLDLMNRAYDAFNARDVEAVLEVLREDVDWPNVLDGVRLHGREQVRAYWTRQFELIDPQLRIESIGVHPHGPVVVTLRQVVRTLDGRLLEDRLIKHVYTLRDGLVARMDVLAE